MSKSILFPLHELRLPPTCVICLSPAPKRYSIQQVFTYGRSSHTITVDVPMCEAHFNTASYKGPAEKATGCLGIGIGILSGIFAAIILFLRWESNNSLILKLFFSSLFGFGIFAIVWWLIAILLAPRLAVPEARQARNAVRITRYVPEGQLVQLDFVNEQVALLVEQTNGSS